MAKKLGVRATNDVGIARVKGLASSIISHQPVSMFGHGFLWVTAYFAGAKGVKFLAAIIDGRSNHNEITRKILEDPQVTTAWINMD